MDNHALKVKRPLVIGHRGYPAKYPENTMISYRAAVDYGVDMIEFDIRLTQDAEIIVIHDSTLDRTTNGTGPVAEHSILELERLDAGGWFHHKYAGERLPTLKEIFGVFGNSTLFNVEIKPQPKRSDSYRKAIVDKLLEAVREFGTQKKVLVSSFDAGILTVLSKQAPWIPRGFLLETAVTEKDLSLASKLGAVSIHPDAQMLDRATIRKIRDRGLLIFVYNILHAEAVRKFFEMGVDGLFLDDLSWAPQEAKAKLKVFSAGFVNA